MLQRCLLILLLAVSVKAGAQEDSVRQNVRIKTVINYILEKDFIYGNPPQYGIDTNLSVADKENPPLENRYNFLGTNGSAAQSQVVVDDKQLYTGTQNRNYDLYILSVEKVPSFFTNKRYTELNYHSGAFKENGISLLHTQNITKNWNAGLYLERMSVKDFMNFSDTYRSRFALFTSYRSNDGRYTAFAHGLWNTIKNDVNGGLTSDSLFENTNVSNLGIKGLAYQISNASQHLRQRTFGLSQYFDLGKAVYDTSGKVVGRNTLLRLHYKISTERKSFTYADTDPDSSFYQNFYYGEETYDSIHTDEIRNRFALQKPAGAFGKSAFMRNWSQGVFFELQNIKYGQRSDTSWNNLSGGANVVWKKDSISPAFFAEAMYVFSGFDKDNYKASAVLTSKRYSFGQLSVQGKIGMSSPDMIYRLYDANNFYWRNDFEKIKYQVATISYTLPQYRFVVSFSHYIEENYVFLNALVLPEQYSSSLSKEQLNIKKDFTYRKFHLDNIFIFQKSGNEEVLHLSDFISENSLYYQSYYFKNALEASTGLRFVYNSAYYSDAFMPANGEFFYQTEKKTGGYLRIDLFINAQIKTATIYLKLENAFDGVFASSYFLTPHYPMPGRVFRFGINWRFFD